MSSFNHQQPLSVYVLTQVLTQPTTGLELQLFALLLRMKSVDSANAPNKVTKFSLLNFQLQRRIAGRPELGHNPHLGGLRPHVRLHHGHAQPAQLRRTWTTPLQQRLALFYRVVQQGWGLGCGGVDFVGVISLPALFC